jgi:hypothetical protein
VITGGLALVGLGWFFLTVGLEQADRWASAIGVFVAVAALAVSLFGVVLVYRARRVSHDPGDKAGGSRAAGGVHQRVRAGRDAYTAGRDQHFGGQAGG